MSPRAKIPQLMLMTLLALHLSSAAVDILAENYSSEPVTDVATATLTSSAARSVIDCAIRCKSTSSACQAFAFVAATKTCVASAVWNADFSVAAPGAAVFRKSGVSWFKSVFAQIGNRTFRVIQQRSNGSLSFARNLVDYENGFGDATDFWMGLKSINSLTGSTPRLLRMEAVTWAGVLFISEYSGFTVGDASTAYTMTFSSYLTGSSNTTSDSLTYHKGFKFSTIDQDNSGHNCPSGMEGGGGFWFDFCGFVNPSGIYCTSAVANGEKNMRWRGADNDNALKSIRLMLQV